MGSEPPREDTGSERIREPAARCWRATVCGARQRVAAPLSQPGARRRTIHNGRSARSCSRRAGARGIAPAANGELGLGPLVERVGWTPPSVDDLPRCASAAAAACGASQRDRSRGACLDRIVDALTNRPKCFGFAERTIHHRGRPRTQGAERSWSGPRARCAAGPRRSPSGRGLCVGVPTNWRSSHQL